MKKIMFLVFFVLVFNALSAQQTALEKVAKETCEYFQSNEEILKLSKNEKRTKLGLKMFSLYNKYQKELNAEGIEVDISNGLSAKEYGRRIGLEMAKFCPNTLLALTGNFNTKEKVESFVKGKIKKIQGNDMNVLVLKAESGKTQKFVWVSNFEGSDELIEKMDNIKGLQVKVYYKNLELFSPKLKEYVVRKQISKIKFLN